MLILNEGYYVDVESTYYKLCKKRHTVSKKDGVIKEKEVEDVVGYYSKIDNCIDRYLDELCRLKLKDSDLTAAEFLEFLKNKKKEIHDIIYGTRETVRE